MDISDRTLDIHFLKAIDIAKSAKKLYLNWFFVICHLYKISDS
jgi:hypothetical protein